MKTITIDNRACGKGKTYGSKEHNFEDGTYGKLRTNIKNNAPTLLVLGSIELQKQYQKQFPIITLINSENKTEYSVVARILDAMDKQELIISITHQAFMMIKSFDNRDQYDIIIDEALGNVFSETKVLVTSKKFVDIKWEEHYAIEAEKDQFPMEMYEDIDAEKLPANEFYRMNLLGFSEDSIPQSSPQYRRITDPNYTHYITPYDYYIMMQTSNSERKTFSIYSLLNQKIFVGWKSIHVAAAAFNKTPMYWLYRKFGLDMTNTQRFIPHTANINLYTCGDNEFKWSNNKRKTQPELLKAFHNHVDKVSTGTVLSLRNVAEKSKLNNELELTHNVHGLNKDEYRDCVNISMESALIYSNTLKLFLKEVLLNQVSQDKQDKLILHFSCGYLFYQAIMRCKLRDSNYNNEKVNLFILDQTISFALGDYFNIELDKISFIDLPYKKKEVISKQEQNRRAYIERKLKKSVESSISVIEEITEFTEIKRDGSKGEIDEVYPGSAKLSKEVKHIILKHRSKTNVV